MFGLEMLDVALGVVFVYLLLSLICSALNEMIEAFMKQRAYNLEAGIRRMLLDSTNSTDIVKKLYNHLLISSLYDVDYATAQKRGIAWQWGKSPSYIPSTSFALALMDLLAPVDPTTPDNKKHSLAALKTAVANSPNDKIKQALQPLINAAGNDIDKVRANIENWYNDTMDRIAGMYERRLWSRHRRSSGRRSALRES